MIAHVIERIAPQVGQLAISCNTNIQQYQMLCDDYRLSFKGDNAWGKCLEDNSSTTLQGPLAGIDRHLNEINSSYCFICSCDMPLIPINIVQILTSRIVGDQHQACHIVNAEGRHQLAILVNTNDAKEALAQISTIKPIEPDTPPKAINYSIKHWLTLMGSISVAFSGPGEQLTSINTSEQLITMESIHL